MQIKQRLQLNTLLSVTAVLVILCGFVAAFYRINAAVKASDLAGQIVTGAFERVAFRNDYMQTGSERAKEQWFAKHAQMSGVIESASRQFTDTEDIETLKELRADHDATQRIFAQIVKNREEMLHSGPPTALSKETEDRLVSQMNMRIYETAFNGRRLRESARADLFHIFKVTGIGIAGLLLFVGSLTLANSWKMGRMITDRVLRLREGAFIIGGGNLDHRIDIAGNDEFADLSGAFNKMTARLGDSYRDLEREMEERKKTEIALRGSEQRFRLSLRNAPVSVAAQDLDLRYIWAFNQRTARPEDIIGHFDHEIFTAEEATRVTDIKRRVIAEDVELREQMWFDRPGGRIFLDICWEPIHNESGRVIGVASATVDLTQIKLAEEALRKSEERFKLSMEATNDGLWDWNAETEEVYYSPAYYHILGYEPGGFAGTLQAWKELVHPDDLERTMRVNTDCVEGRTDVFAVEYRMRAQNGEWRWILGRGKAITRDKNGRAIRLIGTHVDITDRKRAEEALRASEQRLVGVLESMPDAFVSFDSEMRYTYVNASAERLQAAQREELIGKDVRAVYPDPESYKTISQYERVLREQKPITYKSYHAGFDRWVEIRAFPTPDGVSVFYKDISARVKAEQALRRSEARWNAAIESFAEGAIIATEDEQVIYWNPAAREMHGFTHPDEGIEPLDKTPITFQLLTPDGRHMLELDEWPMRRIKRGETVRNLELRIRRPDQGWEKVFSYSGAMVDTTGGERLIFLTCHDLTELRNAEQALRESEERFRVAQEMAPDSFSILRPVRDDQGRVADFVWVYGNPTLESFIGMPFAALKGRRLLEMFPGHRGSSFLSAYQRVAETGQTHVEEALYQGDGALGDRWFRVAVVSMGADIAVLSQDITARKQAEEAIKASLREKETLLKEIHHRVKNNMQVISSLVSLQAQELRDAGLRDILDEVSHRVRSMALVHEKLYQSGDLSQVDFAEYTKSLLGYLWRAHGSATAIQLSLNLEPVLLTVNTAVPCGLMLNELVSNALKHAFRGRTEGEVAVALRSEGSVIHLCVRDNGSGMPPALDWRHARSLGLRLVQMLAGQLHAEVELDSRDGTEFRITFTPKGSGVK